MVVMKGILEGRSPSKEVNIRGASKRGKAPKISEYYGRVKERRRLS